MKNTLLIILLLTLAFNQTKAQQVFNANLYNINPFHLNSAYAGLNGGTEAYLSHRAQWTGINAAPKTFFLSWHSALPKNIGLGANLAYDKTDIISRFSGSLSYSYRIRFSEDHSLGFGLSVGLHQLRITPSNAIVGDATDDLVASGNQSGLAFNNDFSILYSIKKFEFGIAIPQIIEAKSKYNLLDTEGSFAFKRHYIAYAAYDIKMGQKFSMQPSVVYRTFNFSEHQVDINTQVTYNNLLHLGAGYRTNGSMVARFGMNIKDFLIIAYAYQVDFKNVGSYSNGSHEVMLGFKLKKKQQAEPIIVEESETEVPVIKELVEVEKVEEPIVEVSPAIEEQAPAEVEQADQEVFEIHINFPLGSTELDQSFYEALDKIAQELKAHPNTEVIVVGHSCDLGSDDKKEKIALERAEIVKSELIKKGVNASSISVVSKSDKEPLVPNTSEENRAKNRRVEFIIK